MSNGGNSHWKIECDALTLEDWKCLAYLVARRFSFKAVYGVPRGGIPFAEALEKYANAESPNILIVDDVVTTGKSMNEMIIKLSEHPAVERSNIIGIAVFSRAPGFPGWIRPIFRLGNMFDDAYPVKPHEG